jgi:ABC-2 type transport system ATP-binding protein
MNTPHTPADGAVIEARSLRLSYGREPVLQGLDWRLCQGQVVGLLGRNGAGKTTLLETVLGLREPDAGRCSLMGETPTRLSDGARARIGHVPQKAELFPWLTAGQMLAYFKRFYPRWNEAKVQRLLQQWDIDTSKAIQNLSSGQQQRLSIIRAMAHEPDLLVLDEPVASLDPVGRREFLRELIDQVIDLGTTVVFSTHILTDLERVAVEVAFMAQGRIALQAPLEALLETTRRVVGTPQTVAAFMAHPGTRPLSRSLPMANPLVQWALETPAPEGAGIELQRVTLDDLYAGLTS